MDHDSDGTIILDSDEDIPMDLERSPSLLNRSEAGATHTEPVLQSTGQKSDIPTDSSKVNCSIVEDDGLTCPICLDSWTSYGEHRVCALKCGHLFGLNCIERWFTEKQKTCPTCKKKATKSHIRHIYARKLIAVDTSEYENIRKQLADVNEKNKSLQIDLTTTVCREHLLLQQLTVLRKEVLELNTKIAVNERLQTKNNQTPHNTVRVYMDKSLEICKGAGCRVLDHYASQDLLVVSTKSPNPLFQGFGVRKINISSYKPTLFIPLHSKSIRDLSVHPQNSWLLSVSLDKTLKIVDLTSNVSVSAYTKGETPLWSCSWDLYKPNLLYVGSQQGSVLKFDMRNMSEPIGVSEIPGDMSPVISLASVYNTSFMKSGGILVCKLNSLWAFENESNDRRPLSIEGPFISMKYQNFSDHLLLSTRSNSQNPYSRHLLCTIENGANDNLLCNIVHCFPGSSAQTYMSRSCIVKSSSDSYIAAHQESSKSVFLWSISSGQKVCSAPAREPVLDLCSFSVGNDNYITTLTEKKVEFLKLI